MAFTFGTTGVNSSGVAVPLTSGSLRVAQVIIQPKPANAGPVFIGDTTLTASSPAKGLQLNIPTTGPAVQLPVVLKPTATGDDLDLNKIYVQGSGGAGDGVNFLYEIF